MAAREYTGTRTQLLPRMLNSVSLAFYWMGDGSAVPAAHEFEVVTRRSPKLSPNLPSILSSLPLELLI